MTGAEWRRSPEGLREAQKYYSKAIPKMLEADRNMRTIKNFVSISPQRSSVQMRPKRFIEHPDGHFYVKGKLIDFPDPKAIYVLLVEALYTESDSSGFLSYDNISRFLDKKTKNRIADETKKKKRTLNALSNLYRERGRQHTPFPEKTPDNVSVIRKATGEGLIFTNPLL